MSDNDKIFLPPYSAPAFKIGVSVDGGYAYFVRQRDYEKVADDRAKLVEALRYILANPKDAAIQQERATMLLRELGETQA